MVYLNLTNPYRDYNKVQINMIHFISNIKLLFGYQIYKKDGILTEKYITITNENIVNKIKNTVYEKFLPYESICKSLIQYLIDEKIELGTIEITE